MQPTQPHMICFVKQKQFNLFLLVTNLYIGQRRGATTLYELIMFKYNKSKGRLNILQSYRIVATCSDIILHCSN